MELTIMFNVFLKKINDLKHMQIVYFGNQCVQNWVATVHTKHTTQSKKKFWSIQIPQSH
jgi:hypothetical protein